MLMHDQTHIVYLPDNKESNKKKNKLKNAVKINSAEDMKAAFGRTSF